MAFSEEQLESLSRKIEEREKRARRIAWLVTVIPIILAGLLLAYTIQQISIKQNELDQIKKDALALRIQATQANATLAVAQNNILQANAALASATAELDTAISQLATTTVQLGDAQVELEKYQVFGRKACDISEEVVKDYESHRTPQAQVLRYLFNSGPKFNNILWNPGGFSEAEGFDSPDFALYVLQNAIPGLPLVSLDILPRTLPREYLSRVSAAENGDIIYYESGFTMFYYKLPKEYGSSEMIECVIGMTPLKVLAEKIDFATPVEILKVPYPQEQ